MKYIHASPNCQKIAHFKYLPYLHYYQKEPSEITMSDIISILVERTFGVVCGYQQSNIRGFVLQL